MAASRVIARLTAIAPVFLLAGLAAIAPLQADTAGRQAPAVEETWERTLAVTEGSDRWVAGESMMTMEFLDRHGRIDEVMRMLITSTPSEDGVIVEMTELERPGGLIGALMPDGAMNPDAVSGASAGDESSPQGAELINPFLPEVQDSLRIRATGGTEPRHGKDCDEYELGWTAPDGTVYSGIIWLDRVTAAPVELDVTGQSTSDAVRSLEIASTFQSLGPTVVPASVVSFMDYRFALVVRVRVRMTMEFSRYFELP